METYDDPENGNYQIVELFALFYIPIIIASCGSSTRGLWDGPGICNAWKLEGGLARDAACNNVAFEHGATPCLEHVPLCPECSVLIFLVLQQYSCWTKK